MGFKKFYDSLQTFLIKEIKPLLLCYFYYYKIELISDNVLLHIWTQPHFLLELMVFQNN